MRHPQEAYASPLKAFVRQRTSSAAKIGGRFAKE